MTVQSFTFNPFMTNTYVCHHEGEAVIVDASPQAAEEVQQVLDYVADHDLEVRHLLLTHAHIDHIFGCALLSEHYGLPWRLHPEDRPFVQRAMEQATMFGVQLDEPPQLGDALTEDDAITFGGRTWRVLHTPGHSPGSVSFYDADAATVLSGDVLFQGSIGRTDLPGGSMPTLMRSIFDHLIPLGEATTVLPGHGPATTIGQERQQNPFLTGQGAPM